MALIKHFLNTMNYSFNFSPLLLLPLLFTSIDLFAQTPCVDGDAGGYPCRDIDLLAHVSPEQLGAEEHKGVWLNDIWGWTDPETGREYALVGMTNGTSFVDITDPLNPVVVGMLPEHHAAGSGKLRGGANLHEGEKSQWRDIKVYQDHAYIVSEDEEHGMQVFDLRQLRDVENPPFTFSETANYQGISNAHNIVINEETGYAFAVGANRGDLECSGGGLHMIDIREPASPVFAGCFDEDGYTHDAECVIYRGPDNEHAGKEICFSANADAITLVDVSDKENPVMISSQSYLGAGYVHQGWLTEDQRFFISNDELDELQNGHNTTSYIWDMQDLDNPVMIGRYVGPNPSIDHNLYIRDLLVYQANYTSGLRILNLFDIEEAYLAEVAFFDTYPANNEAHFLGAWSNYPYFASGVVVVSDITNGLFILRPTLGLIGEDPADVLACEGREAVLSVLPNQNDGTYQWQVDQGEGFTELENNETYSQVTERSLLISGVSKEMEAYLYRVKVVSANGVSEEVSESAMLEVTNSVPEAAFTYEEEDGLFTFVNQSENADTYIWDFGDGTPPVNAVSPSHRYERAGPYEVSLEAVNGCGSDIFVEAISVVTGLELEEEKLSRSLNLFPNPTEGIIRLQMTNYDQKIEHISLYNINGKKLLEKKVAAGQQQGEYIFDISSYGKGVYVMKITSGPASATKRVIVK